MLIELNVLLYGKKVGTLFDDGINISFYYSNSFKLSGLEISPIKLNTTKIKGHYSNDDFIEIYNQLPGIFKDSLPDSNGTIIMDNYFRATNRDPSRLSVLERLSFIGNRGMGALEYEPKEEHDKKSNIFQYSIDAQELYIRNKQLHQSNKVLHIDEIMSHMIDSASPVGGAKEKTLVFLNPISKKLRFYSNNLKFEGFEPYILKFDSKDIYKEDTKKEYLYNCLAKLCGIDVPDFELLHSDGMSHFLIKRFDRVGTKKIHMATASALLHIPHIRSAISYEELAKLTYTLTKNIEDVKKLIHQMMFNILTGVTDDHSKNFSFLMDIDGKWSLSPAYDLIYGLGVGALKHKCTLMGKNENFKITDVYNLASKYGIANDFIDNRFEKIIQVISENFENICQKAQLSSTTQNGIAMYIEEKINSF